MGREDQGVTHLQQARLVLIIQSTEKQHVAQLQFFGLLLEFSLLRPATEDHHRVINALQGAEQCVQTFVIAQHADEQKELARHALLPF